MVVHIVRLCAVMQLAKPNAIARSALAAKCEWPVVVELKVSARRVERTIVSPYENRLTPRSGRSARAWKTPRPPMRLPPFRGDRRHMRMDESVGACRIMIEKRCRVTLKPSAGVKSVKRRDSKMVVESEPITSQALPLPGIRSPDHQLNSTSASLERPP